MADPEAYDEATAGFDTRRMYIGRLQSLGFTGIYVDSREWIK